ncbi:MAG: CidA/LrgA family protein [Clostridia bacterium]|nr:CidA/LrgA family protein [Clostridia bacterium]
MKIFGQIIRLFTLCCIGDLISLMLPFPFPGSVIALVLLFLLLISGLIKTEQINTVSDFLLKNMSFVFLPSTVSIISYIDVFKSIIWQFLFICIITTVITFFATAYAVKFTIYLMNKFRKESKDA